MADGKFREQSIGRAIATGGTRQTFGTVVFAQRFKLGVAAFAAKIKKRHGETRKMDLVSGHTFSLT